MARKRTLPMLPKLGELKATDLMEPERRAASFSYRRASLFPCAIISRISIVFLRLVLLLREMLSIAKAEPEEHTAHHGFSGAEPLVRACCTLASMVSMSSLRLEKSVVIIIARPLRKRS